MLELLLQNKDLRRDLHTAAEGSFRLYAIAHLALIASGKRQLSDSVAAGLNAGAVTYESIAAAVRPEFIDCSDETILEQTGTLSLLEQKNQLLNAFTDARDQFTDTQPRTRDVILAVVNRYDRTLGESALVGAAITRQIELGTLRVT